MIYICSVVILLLGENSRENFLKGKLNKLFTFMSTCVIITIEHVLIILCDGSKLTCSEIELDVNYVYVNRLHEISIDDIDYISD